MRCKLWSTMSIGDCLLAIWAAKLGSHRDDCTNNLMCVLVSVPTTRGKWEDLYGQSTVPRDSQVDTRRKKDVRERLLRWRERHRTATSNIDGRKKMVEGRCARQDTISGWVSWLGELMTAKVRKRKRWARKLVKLFLFSVRLGKVRAVLLTRAAESITSGRGRVDFSESRPKLPTRK